MRRMALLLITPLIFMLAVACEEENGSDPAPTAQVTPLFTEQPTEAATSEPAETAEPTEDEPGDDDSARSGDLFGSFNPFSALQGLNGNTPTSTQVDPALKAMLLTSVDLPSFLSFGEYAFTVPDERGGTLDAAASLFMSGDVASIGEFGTMVMSMVARIPPGQDMGDLAELDELSQAELDEIAATTDEFGMSYAEIRTLDASGLGDSGGAMHMVMDLGEIFNVFGERVDEHPFEAGIAMDFYVFARGETMLLLMVMYNAGAPAPVDGHALAEIMDGRAS